MRHIAEILPETNLRANTLAARANVESRSDVWTSSRMKHLFALAAILGLAGGAASAAAKKMVQRTSDRRKDNLIVKKEV